MPSKLKGPVTTAMPAHFRKDLAHAMCDMNRISARYFRAFVFQGWHSCATYSTRKEDVGS